MTSFKFYPTESKIYDYLFFPTIARYVEDHKEVDNHRGDVPKEYMQTYANICAKLQPYKEILSRSYYEEVSLISLLGFEHCFFGYKSVDDYLDQLSNLNDNQILRAIIYAIELKESDANHSKESQEYVESLLKDESNLMGWINNLTYSGETKWQLLCFSKNPKASIEECIDTLRALKPLFEEFYKHHEEDIKYYGEDFAKKLNSLEGDALAQASNNTINNSVIEGDIANLLISHFNGYGILTTHIRNPNFLVWGRYLEEFFEKMKSRAENQLAERVLLFKNLGDKTRYEVLKLIAQGVTSTKIIAQRLAVSSATISYHTSNLTTSKLIAPFRQEGRIDFIVNEEYIEECFSELKKDLNLK